MLAQFTYDPNHLWPTAQYRKYAVDRLILSDIVQNAGMATLQGADFKAGAEAGCCQEAYINAGLEGTNKETSAIFSESCGRK